MDDFLILLGVGALAFFATKAGASDIPDQNPDSDQPQPDLWPAMADFQVSDQSTISVDPSGATDYTAQQDQSGSVDVQYIPKPASLWAAPSQYASLIAQSEQSNGLPSGMLERLLYQESHYRAEVIDGTVRSTVGALGIAQFMPATAKELGIDPLEPTQAIPAAAKYLARLYRASGSWAGALAAYNWGIGNVLRKGLSNPPTETLAYYTSILTDVNIANGTDIA